MKDASTQTTKLREGGILVLDHVRFPPLGQRREKGKTKNHQKKNNEERTTKDRFTVWATGWGSLTPSLGRGSRRRKGGRCGFRKGKEERV